MYSENGREFLVNVIFFSGIVMIVTHRPDERSTWYCGRHLVAKNAPVWPRLKITLEIVF